MFWEAVESLRRWEREHLPGSDTDQGNEILVWLLKCQGTRKPLKTLYRSSRYSEPTVRACLQIFVDRGFIVIEQNGNDLRSRYAHGTRKFYEAVMEYQKRLEELAVLAERARLATSSELKADVVRTGNASPPPS